MYLASYTITSASDLYFVTNTFCASASVIMQIRQIGFWLGFVITLFTTPIIGLIVISLSSKETVNVVFKEKPSEKSKVGENEKTSVADELHKLFELKEKGIITEEEFITQKEKILN